MFCTPLVKDHPQFSLTLGLPSGPTLLFSSSWIKKLQDWSWLNVTSLFPYHSYR